MQTPLRLPQPHFQTYDHMHETTQLIVQAQGFWRSKAQLLRKGLTQPGAMVQSPGTLRGSSFITDLNLFCQHFHFPYCLCLFFKHIGLIKNVNLHYEFWVKLDFLGLMASLPAQCSASSINFLGFLDKYFILVREI